MKTHLVWILVLANLTALATVQALAQSPVTFAAPTFGAPNYGGPSYAMAPAGYQIATASCESGACGGCAGCDSGGGVCGGCGTQCGGRCGLGGMMGGAMMGGGLGGAAMAQLQAMNASQHGGFSTQMLGQQNGPFGGGGCCAPMWYDFHIEWMMLGRDDNGGNVNLTSRNANGPIVLSTDDVSLDQESGFRATYSLLIGPSTALEGSYFGTHDWDGRASVTGNGDLYSVFSNFGTNPIYTPLDDLGNPLPTVVGFPQTVDQADLHNVSLASELHNVEVNLRRRWTSSNCLFHGSYLAGVRYVALDEFLNYNTHTPLGGSLNYDLNTQNDAVGFQVGLDGYVCLTPRFKIGLEAEGGIYGNRTKAKTLVTGRSVIVGASPSDIVPVNESESDTDAAFVGEAGVIGIFRLTPRMSIRGGYQVIVLDGFALATENFNTAAPLVPASSRNAFVDNGGNVLYDGATLGFEFLW